MADQPPVVIRRIRADEGLKLRELRLQALGQAPTAFGSSLAREQAFPESTWHERAAGGAAGSDRATFVAEDADRWVGMATGVARHPEDLEHSPILISMFVDPTQRGRGVGAALVETVTEWVRALNAEQLYLWATSTNRPAIALYEKCGFRLTAERRPLDHTPSLAEVLMVRSLRSWAGGDVGHTARSDLRPVSMSHPPRAAAPRNRARSVWPSRCTQPPRGRERHDDDHEEGTMKAKKIGAKDRSGRERVRKDLVAKKSSDVRGGARDAASGLPTGKRTN